MRKPFDASELKSYSENFVNTAILKIRIIQLYVHSVMCSNSHAYEVPDSLAAYSVPATLSYRATFSSVLTL